MAGQASRGRGVLRLTCGGISGGRSGGEAGGFFFVERSLGEGAEVECVVAEARRVHGGFECVVCEASDAQTAAALRFQLLGEDNRCVVSWLKPAPCEDRDGFWGVFTEDLARGFGAGAGPFHCAFSTAYSWLENQGDADQGGGRAAAAADNPVRVSMMWCTGEVPGKPNIRFNRELSQCTDPCPQHHLFTALPLAARHPAP